MPRPRKPRPPRDEHAPTSFTPDVDIWTYAIQNLDAEATATTKETFLSLYERGASPKEAAYAAEVSYRQIILWQHDDALFREHMELIAAERRANPELAKAIFLDHLARTHNHSAAAEAGGFLLSEFKAMRKTDRAFRKAWKHALREAVDNVEGALFEDAVHGPNPLTKIVVLNAHRTAVYKPETRAASSDGDRTLVVKVIFGKEEKTNLQPPPIQLPPQSGEEIVIDAEVDDGS